MDEELVNQKPTPKPNNKKLIIILSVVGAVILIVVVGLIWWYLSKAKTTTIQTATQTTGSVTDLISQEPISDAKISYNGKSSNSDSSGNFKFAQNQTTQELEITASGYNTKKVTLTKATKVTLTPAGTIVFVSNRDGKRGLYQANYDGSSDKAFVARVDDKEDFSPVISPRERYVVFLSTRDGRKSQSFDADPMLYMANIDGTNLAKISEFYNITSIGWSPDGTYIAWTGREKEDSRKIIAIRDVTNGTTEYIGSDLGDVDSYSFSEDDSKVAFSVYNSDDPSKEGIYVASGNGTDPNKIYDKTALPRFNSDGNLEFIVYDGGDKNMIWFKDSGKVKEVQKDDTKRTGTLSHNKKLVAYIDNRDGKNNLFVSAPNKSGEKKLTSVDAATEPIRWTQNDKYIIFSVQKESETARYIVAAAGTGKAVKIIDEYAYDDYHEY